MNQRFTESPTHDRHRSHPRSSLTAGDRGPRGVRPQHRPARRAGRARLRPRRAVPVAQGSTRRHARAHRTDRRALDGSPPALRRPRIQRRAPGPRRVRQRPSSGPTPGSAVARAAPVSSRSFVRFPARTSVAKAAVNALLAVRRGMPVARSRWPFRRTPSSSPCRSRMALPPSTFRARVRVGRGQRSRLTRLGQVVYTPAQFPTVKSVVFQIEGETKSVFNNAGVVRMARSAGPITSSYSRRRSTVRPTARRSATLRRSPVRRTSSRPRSGSRSSTAAARSSRTSRSWPPAGRAATGTFDTTIPYNVAKAQ